MTFTGKGRITISRPQSSRGKEWIRIQIEDEASRSARVTVSVNLDDFARALTGLGHVAMEAEWMGTQKLGTKGENKSEVIPGIGYDSTGEELVQKASAFEVDGWEAELSDDELKGSFNFHRISKKGYTVHFFRNVPLLPKDL